MNRLLYILSFLLFACNTGKPFFNSNGADSRSDYMIVVKMVDDTRNYAEVMRVLHTNPAAVDEEYSTEGYLWFARKIIRAYYSGIQESRINFLRSELQKCEGIIEIKESKMD